MNLWSNRRVRYTTCAVGATALAVPLGIGLATTNSVATPAAVQAVNSTSTGTAGTPLQVAKLPSSVLIKRSALGSGWKRVDVAKLKQQMGAKYQASAGSPFDAAKLKQMLGSVSVSPSACADLLKVGDTQDAANVTGAAARMFTKGNSMFGPYAGQVVVQFDSAESAAAALAKAQTAAAACSDVTVTTKYGPANASVTPISVPAVGDEQVGYSINATMGGFISVESQVAAVRKGDRVVVVAQVGTSTSDSLTKTMTRKAAKRN